MRSRSLISNIAPVAIVAIVAATSSIAFAAEMHDDTQHLRSGSSISTVADGLPGYIPRLGTFAGDVSALRIRGVGNFFYLSNPLNGMDQPCIRPKAKILQVNSTPDACLMERSVCVIRP